MILPHRGRKTFSGGGIYAGSWKQIYRAFCNGKNLAVSIGAPIEKHFHAGICFAFLEYLLCFLSKKEG